ncbi:MAG: T9SS type A sorting domain-containing protein [Calditrichaeota bacterium]|nr:T9SS type A sorting domain-containing protein [Calditrichota bacterium]
MSDDWITLWNVNNIAGWIRNDGQSAHSPADESGVTYPRGTATTVYTDGLIWGGKVIQSHFGGNPGSFRVGGQTYRIGTTPGYIVNPGTSTTPPVPSNPNGSFVYRIRADWETLNINDPQVINDAAELNMVPPSQVTPAMAQAILDDYQDDWNNWPGDIGAPYYDLNSNGQWDPGTDAPGLQEADQVIWFVINDLDQGATLDLYGSQPIGLEVQVTMWNYNTSGPLGQAVYQRYRLINKSGFAIDSMFLAAKWADPDVGAYTDDFAGCDIQLQAGYGYNGSAIDADYQSFGLPPAAIGYVLLQGPLVPSPGDSAWFDFRRIEGYLNLPMTSFGYFASNSPITDPSLGSYDGTLEWYNLLNGFIPTTDTLNPDPFITGSGPNAGNPTKFPLSGDPLNQSGDIDGFGSNFPPGDRRITINTGPFTLQNGDTQEVVFALVGGIDPAGDHLSAVMKLKEHIQTIRDQYPQTGALPRGTYQVNHPNGSTTDLQVRADLREFSDITTAEASFAPEIGSEPGFNLQLYDDGAHQDSLAGDGIWGNSLTLDNRKYPFKGDLNTQSASGARQFENVYTRMRLRPLPDFTNWRVVWENGQQDSSINYQEKVNLRFDVENRDLLQSIDEITVFNYAPAANGQVIQYHQTVTPGGTASDEQLYFFLQGPEQGDTLSFTCRLIYDGHGQIRSFRRPLAPWTPLPTWGDTLGVSSVHGVTTNLFPIIADPQLLNGHNYQITYFPSPDSSETLWRLYDLTSGAIRVDNHPIVSDPLYPHPIIDGILFMVTNAEPGFSSFQVVANAAGPLDPPEQGCLAFSNGFPLLNGSDRPDPARQQANGSTWGIHTAMTSSNDGSYDYFLVRVSQGGARWPFIIPYDFEIRFTAGPNWGLAPDAFVGGSPYGGTAIEMPLELWNIGDDTPDDPSDDYRLFPYLIDSEADGLFNLAPIDHVVSTSDNDPETDWFYWVLPADQSPGQAGYEVIADEVVNNTAAHEYLGPLTAGTDGMRRMVLVNWNGGDVYDPTFPANVDALMPEAGTIFRIISAKPNVPGDTLLVQGMVGISETPPVSSFELYQNYPNPFNPATQIRFSLAHRVKVKLEIFNLLGQRVKTLVNAEMAPGQHRLRWDGRNDAGLRVSSGVYFYRLKAGDYVKSRKMILIR